MTNIAVPDTLWGLVQHYSPSNQEAGAVAFLVERMKALGFEHAFTDEAGNAIAMMGNGPRQIILLGHIDTVSGEIPLRLEGDTLYGRGCVDAKGALAAFVDSVASIGAQPGWQFVVIGAVDEEGDSRGARYIIERYRPDYVIIGEPSQWNRITLGYKGSLWVEILTRRPVSHTAGEAESACEAAVAIWQIIQKWAETYNQGKERLFDRVSSTLRKMSSGGDGFEDWACIEIGVRLPPSLSPQACRQHLERCASEKEATIKVINFPTAAYFAEKNTPLVRAFLSSIRAMGGQPGFVLKSGTADMNIVAPVWECPTIAYGPGDSALDHTPNEHISLEEYRRSVEVLKRALKSLSGLTDPP